MAACSIFTGFDPAALDRITEALGTRMAAAIALTATTIARDPTVSPALMAAGMLRAHLLGAASAIASAESAGAITIDGDEQLADDAVATIMAALRDMRDRR